MSVFEPAMMGKLSVKNRIVRSATYEGLCDRNGMPTPGYGTMYRALAAGDCGTIITGFAYITRQGRAIQPLQAGIDSDDTIDAYKRVTDDVHSYGCRIIMQIAHTGRQTRSSRTGLPVVGVSRGASRYFREQPRVLSKEEIGVIAEQFVDAAARAQRAGFDGVQLHAAHGYLLHQFLLPSINRRRDEYGVDPSTGMAVRFLEEIIDGIRRQCSKTFALLVKLSGAVEGVPFSPLRFGGLISFLDSKKIDGIEISYGTMGNALNIFRGTSIPLDDILDHDPVYRLNHRPARFLWKLFAAPVLAARVKRFHPMYNLSYAEMAKKRYTSMPVISVGGFRSSDELHRVIESGKVDFISMCRPFIAEPDIAGKMMHRTTYRSYCINCNRCAVTTGSDLPTVCRRR
ncbi:MAG: NADH:flavin oxidoreductase [Chitinispirillaceae bacterium]|nr:NADH:flavin oxidoreductase [Chitinispirillaceae bacterium]